MNIERYIDLFCSMLESDKLKCSTIRQDILRTFFKHKHLSVDEIATEVEASKQTIYRTLKLLLSYNIISKVTYENIPLYELTRGQDHFHIVCVSCKKLLEFNDKQLKIFLQELAQKDGFSAKQFDLTLYGRCKECSDDNKYQ